MFKSNFWFIFGLSVVILGVIVLCYNLYLKKYSTASSVNISVNNRDNLEFQTSYSGIKVVAGKISKIRSTEDNSFLTDVYTDKNSNNTKIILVDVDSLIYDIIELDSELNVSQQSQTIIIDQLNKKFKTVKSVYEELEYYTVIENNTKYILVKNGKKIFKNKFINDYRLNKFLE